MLLKVKDKTQSLPDSLLMHIGHWIKTWATRGHGPTFSELFNWLCPWHPEIKANYIRAVCFAAAIPAPGSVMKMK